MVVQKFSSSVTSVQVSNAAADFYTVTYLFFFLCVFLGNVFVHCAVGVSRSAALVLAYLMIHQHLTLLSSVRCVQQKRWIFPNRGFLKQLLALDQKVQQQRVE